nr:isoform 2 of tmv resistance protein n [Quercus suber]
MNFTDHLYTALKQKGIITFRDDEKLERGKYISVELLKAIEESKYAIIVLSTNYAFSKWCLIELAKIVECMEKTKLTVLPVFYHVDPSDVRNQRGTLAKAFAKHEEDTKVNTEDMQAWKAALKDVGHLSGWHVHDRHESIVIQEILKKILGKRDLFSTFLRHRMIRIIKRGYNPNRLSYLTIPGSEIPNWFRHQNVGASVNLQVPSHLLLSSKFLGIALCAVYIFRQHHRIYTQELCLVKVNGYTYFGYPLSLSEEFGKIESYHLWLQYFPFTRCRWKEELDANEFTQIEVTFVTDGPGWEVTKCGAHLIFEQDIEDLNQTKPGSSSCTISPYYEDDDLGDSEKDAKIKESRDDEPPHPKWTEHPNLIENWIGNSCIQGQGDSDCE